MTAEEFNLQFARLNLGTIINSGERLHAMIGELRNICFDDLGSHEFLSTVPIPTRRFAREQLAAQIVAQVFAIESSPESGVLFARTRHLDLQRLFKTHVEVPAAKKAWILKLRTVMDLLVRERHAMPQMRSRAIVLSAVLLAYQEEVDASGEVGELAQFLGAFVQCLTWQIRKRLDADREYEYLLEFQRHLRQASVERPAVSKRAEMLTETYKYWRENDHRLPGDTEFAKRTGDDPKAARVVAARA